jgi:hypothetical protein
MSRHAPWLALAIDWNDSPMFDGSNHGVRLAWIDLLCFVKAQGRAGKVRLRDKAFANQYRLTVEAVEEMLVKATNGGAITRQGDEVTVLNWKQYQDPSRRKSKDEFLENNDLGSIDTHFSKSGKKYATKDQGPSTDHQGPSTSQSEASVTDDEPIKSRRFVPPTVEEVAAYCLERKNGLDPELFWNHYAARDWVVKGSKIKSWKACVITWEKNRGQYDNRTPHRTPGPGQRFDPGKPLGPV